MKFAILGWLLYPVVTLMVATADCRGTGGAADSGWIELIGENGLERWKQPTGDWIVAGGALPDSANPARLIGEPGRGVIVNGRTGKTRNLLSAQEFGDIETHFEFLIPKGSNSGIKFEALYEIQIIDSVKTAKTTGSDCGGIYPRAEMLPRYHHIDDGIAPRLNAARPYGEWQTLDVRFRAPRFDAAGNKIRDARFEKVVLNGHVIHDQVDVPTPTGHVWRVKEVARGPILLQADHGPVAFRNIRVRPLD